MLAHVLETSRKLAAERICVVYGHGGDAVRERFPDADLQLGAAGSAAGDGPCPRAGAAATWRRRRDARAFGADPLARAETLETVVRHARGGRSVAPYDRARRSHRLWPHRPRRRRHGAGDRRAQGRDGERARDPRDQHRRDGGADAAFRALAAKRSATATQAANTTSPMSSRMARKEGVPIETSQAGSVDRDAGRQHDARARRPRAALSARAGGRAARRRSDARRPGAHRRPRHACLRRRRDDRRRLRVRRRRCGWAMG